MDLKTCQRITESFEVLLPDLNRVVIAFYGRLFTRAPHLRALFPQDMTRQHAHVGASIAIVSRNIAHLDLLREPLMSLGAQHLGFGARPADYFTVRDAMLDGFADVGGVMFTAQLRQDWNAALNEVIALMLCGAIAAAMDGSRARTPVKTE